MFNIYCNCNWNNRFDNLTHLSLECHFDSDKIDDDEIRKDFIDHV